MAKFRNPENGEVYDIRQTGDCESSGFCSERDCDFCPISGKLSSGGCSEWVDRHPEEAAELMGYEFIAESDKNVDQPAVTRTSILEAARRCVCGDREQDYGSPETSFRAIAELWKPYLAAKCVSPGADVELLPEDVAAMMVLFKMARVATGHGKADNWIDAAGYAACGGEIEGGNQ